MAILHKQLFNINSGCIFSFVTVFAKLFPNLLTVKAIFSRHYAGDVVYNIKGFLEKNKDTLFQDFKRLMYSSSDPVISNMWPEGAQDITMVSVRPSLCVSLEK